MQGQPYTAGYFPPYSLRRAHLIEFPVERTVPVQKKRAIQFVQEIPGDYNRI
jgi:hypothetical protein